MHSIRLLAYPGVALLDVAAPLQAFRTASQYQADDAPRYAISLVSALGGPVDTSIGSSLDTSPFEPAPVDTFLLPGGADVAIDAVRRNAALLQRIRDQADISVRVGAMGPGALILAEAGLLRGRRIATHWTDSSRWTSFQGVQFVADAFTVDGKYWTSGGMLSGADLALAMVERDLGRAIADKTARHLVAEIRRSPGEPQLSPRLEAHDPERNRIRKLMQWIVENPDADLSTEALAQRANLSVRSLHRHFAAETGGTPARFVERARVQSALRQLARTDASLDAIAAGSGFGSRTTMQRVFARVLHVTPSQYRRRLRG